MKHRCSRNFLCLQPIIVLFLSAIMILGTVGTGLLNSLPSEYRHEVYAQEVCEWYNPTCVGDYVGDDDAAVEPPADTGTPAPAEEAPVGDDDAAVTPVPDDTGAATPQVSSESKMCDPSQYYCYPTDAIVDSNGQVVCDGTQYDCSAYSGEPPSEAGSSETCDPSVSSCLEQGYTTPVLIPDGPDTEPGQTVQVLKEECSTISHTSDAKGKTCRALCWSAGAGCAAFVCTPPHAVITCVGVGFVCGGAASLCSDECTENFPPEPTTETVCKNKVEQPLNWP